MGWSRSQWPSRCRGSRRLRRLPWRSKDRSPGREDFRIARVNRRALDAVGLCRGGHAAGDCRGGGRRGAVADELSDITAAAGGVIGPYRVACAGLDGSQAGCKRVGVVTGCGGGSSAADCLAFGDIARSTVCGRTVGVAGDELEANNGLSLCRSEAVRSASVGVSLLDLRDSADRTDSALGDVTLAQFRRLRSTRRCRRCRGRSS